LRIRWRRIRWRRILSWSLIDIHRIIVLHWNLERLDSKPNVRE
jgi:hypothetical protein